MGSLEWKQKVIFNYGNLLYDLFSLTCYLRELFALRRKRKIAVIGSETLARVAAYHLQECEDVVLFLPEPSESVREYTVEGLSEPLAIGKRVPEIILGPNSDLELENLAKYLGVTKDSLEKEQRKILRTPNGDGFFKVDVRELYPLKNVEMRSGYRGILPFDDRVEVLSDKLEKFDFVIFVGHSDLWDVFRLMKEPLKISAVCETKDGLSVKEAFEAENGRIQALPGTKGQEIICLTGSSKTAKDLRVHSRVFVLDPISINSSIEPFLDLLLISRFLPGLLREPLENDPVTTQADQAAPKR